MSFCKKKWQCYIIYQTKFFIIFTEIYSNTILYFEMLQYYKSNSGQKITVLWALISNICGNITFLFRLIAFVIYIDTFGWVI